MKRRLITSALPYVNNVPHLGNLIQVLSADVFARFSRLKGYETMYICGTDEYGTATQTRAREEGITPQELCDRYYKIHTDIYEWFQISFDKWGRTSSPEHTEITQHIFNKLDENGYISQHTIKQLYSPKDEMFLADRFVLGTCPHCQYEDARGDQCENCGKLLDPMELINPRSAMSGDTPEVRETTHLYINLPAILPKLEEWMKVAKVEGHWANNAVRMTEAWIRDGLKERGITRDLKWGIPVPKDGFRDKVFYVWFDACIGYISITATLTDQWESWWRNPDEVDLYQFIGKDNIPFHTVVFPCSLLGGGETWTMLHHMSSTEYLNYETGKFSKTRGVGVFGSDAMETGIPADVWRFYIFYNRPESSDGIFTWQDFQEKVNGELIGNLANLVNRTLTFTDRNFGGELPAGEGAAGSDAFWKDVHQREEAIGEALEKVEIRRAFHQIFHLSSVGNKRFQDAEPWKVIKEDRGKVAGLLWDLVYLIRDLAILIEPYIPETSRRIGQALGLESMSWDQLGKREGISKIAKPDLLFRRLEDKEIEAFHEKFSGTQAERESLADKFGRSVDLRVARIEKVERHPKADKLYVETISLGSETRQIVSGLVPHYQAEELEGRNVILVANLKPAKLRGVESQGMLLAAETGDIVEVVFADHAEPGTQVVLSDQEPGGETAEITIDDFFAIPIGVADHVLNVEGVALEVSGKTLSAEKVENGKVR